MLAKLQILVKYFRSCPENNNKLIAMQQKLNVPVVKLKLQNDTRWNSVFTSMESVINSQQAIVNLGLEDQEVADVTLSLIELQEIRKKRDILSPFLDITDILCTSKSLSISMIKPLIISISRHILKITRHDSDICETMKLLIFEDFMNRVKQYDDVNDLLLLSTILDPRFKDLEFLDAKERDRAQSLLKAKFDEHRSTDCNSSFEDNIPNTQTPKKVKKLNNEAMLNIFKFSSSSNRTVDEYREIKLYFQDQGISILENPLEWWKTNAASYKIISLIARDALLIPATSVPSERVFSKAGDIVTEKRSSLASKNIDVLLFLAENQK